MQTINGQLIEALLAAGVSTSIIDKYTSELPKHTDNLEILGCYWAKKIATLNVNIRNHADVCIFLRDTQSEVLWLNLFKSRVIPLIKEYDILAK